MYHSFKKKEDKTRIDIFFLSHLDLMRFFWKPVFTCGKACKSRDDKKSVGGGGGVVVCPELLSKEEVELWFCPELLSKTLVNGKNDA